ncbi:calcium-activated BK potassium channel alpha subunit-domain-containing protein [Paraphysoderma sedebokerense]|nr:calcium-activated BK potassium channel alpha subunit-domain-containing protein [Paraphysoderma sedebokerense]
MRTVFSFVGIIDFLTCLPFLLSLQIPNGNFLFIPYFLRSMVVTPRIRRLLNIQVELSEGEGAEPFDPLKEKLIVLILTILAIVYTGVCSFIYVELMFADKRYDLVSALYFIMITVSTVGYGDISPSSIAGRVVIILLIIIALSVIPGLIQSTVETVNRTREGGGSFAPGKSEFVVIIGTFDTVSRVNDILQAFFNKESFSNTKQKLVFLSRKSAPPAVTAILSTHFYQSWASYIQGSALNERDLRRVQLKNASAIFIVTDFNSASVVEDERNVLRVWSINRFAPNVPLYVYLNRPEFETYHIQFARDVACVEDIKQALLAYNCLYRGSSTLILSLLINIIPLKQYEKPWMVQFGDGLGNEIYERRVNEIFVGMSFAEVSWYLYREFQVILMAVRTRIHNERGATEHHPNDSDYYSHIILNPGKSYIFKAHDDCIYIAQGPSDIDDIEDLTRDQYFRSTQVSPIMDPTYKLMSQVYPSISKSLRGSHASLVSSMRSRSPSPTRSLANMVTSPEIQICPPSPDKSDFISIRSAAETALTSVSEPEAPFAECKVPLCHVLDTPATLEDCIIQNASHLYRHIIACTQNYNVFRIVCTLRIAHLKPDEIRPIVFLRTVLPTEEEFEPLKTFPHVYFMLGNPRSRRDLIRANIGAADKVFITPDDTGASDENDRDFCDAESILTKHVITKVATEHGDPNKLCIVEILERESVHFLGVKYQADGGLLALKKKKKKRKAANAIVDFTYDEKYASGEALVTPMLDTILYQSHSNHCLLEMVKLLTGIRSHEDLELDRYLNVEPSYLCYIDVPKTCVGKPFSLFYQILTLNFGVVPLGLYRRPDASLENTNSFVYTNPMARILLKSSDLVYVLKSGRD